MELVGPLLENGMYFPAMRKHSMPELFATRIILGRMHVLREGGGVTAEMRDASVNPRAGEAVHLSAAYEAEMNKLASPNGNNRRGS